MTSKEIILSPIFDRLYEYEIDINKNVQEQMVFGEYMLNMANTYMDPQIVLDYWIPLLGIFGHKQLTRMVMSVGIVNVISSLFKWTLPEYRPVWWIKEFNSTHKFQNFNIEVNTCDTSAGFPSSHTVTFAAFAFAFLHSLITRIGSHCFLKTSEKYLITHAVVLVPVGFLCFCRLYVLTEFLHQCLGGYVIVMVTLHILYRNSSKVLRLKTMKTCITVLFLGSFAIGVYFAMLYLDEDPHWSVRMAFKWCVDPTLMRHEAGPIFSLFRDFGYLLGIALSCPLFHNFKTNNASVFKRFPVVLVVFSLNLFASRNTPKHLGRWVFLFYELGRSCAFSYALLTIIPKIVK